VRIRVASRPMSLTRNPSDGVRCREAANGDASICGSNAGCRAPPVPPADLSVGMAFRLDINVTGTFLCTRARVGSG